MLFFEEWSQSGGSPVILSLIARYNEAYTPLYEVGKVMKPLTELHSAETMKLSYPELLQKCEEVFETISFSFSQAQKVEMTRIHDSGIINEQQLLSRGKSGIQTAHNCRHFLWSHQCYPEIYKAMYWACKYGCEHENIAKDKYVELLGKSHNDFFVIHHSPFWCYTRWDSYCTCYGAGVLEIKCPFCCKRSFI